jgi:Icc-related predicted phosphoesterase
MTSTDRVRIAAIGDIHCHRRSKGMLIPLFSEINRTAEILLLCGDLTDYGLPEEAKILAEELNSCVNIPVVGVLGNHDFESNKPNEVRAILSEANVTLLDGDACEIRGVGFAGVKGFGGGFERSLEAWGEPIIKQFVHEAVDEALKLEGALARLDVRQKVAVLHYSPIRATVEGEPLEIIPFLGSRRLEEPLNRFHVQAVFHGHAHFGSPEGRTSGGSPVYNVAMPLLKRCFPHLPPYRVIELEVPSEDQEGTRERVDAWHAGMATP